jgi:hypothetical protein
MWPIEFIKKIIHCMIGKWTTLVGDGWSLGKPTSEGLKRCWNQKSESISPPEHREIFRSQPTPVHISQKTKQIVSKGKIILEIGLHPDYYPSLPKRIRVTISDDMDARELAYHLSKNLGVNENRWKLIVISDEKSPIILDKNSKLNGFQHNKKERLYFYPEIRVR